MNSFCSNTRFFGSTDAAVLKSIVEKPPVPPHELDPNFPSALTSLLFSALAKDPNHRVASAADMRVAVEAYLTDTQSVDEASPAAISTYMRELYEDRIELLEQAKSADDDSQLLQALRGFVRRPSPRAAEVESGHSEPATTSTGPYALPHSMVDLNYARVPTADLPVIRRIDESSAPAMHRPQVDDLLEEQDELLVPPNRSARSFEARLGRYQLLEVIEQSALRYVQKARLVGPLGFTKDVVLRRLPTDRVNDPEWISPLVREAKVRANLNHPHIESLLDFDDQPEAFFAVEPLDGWRLDRVLEASARGHRPPAQLDVALRVVLDVVEALDYLHTLDEPILHRSIEPAAVHLHRNGRSKLSGFDVARPLNARVPYMHEPRRVAIDRLAPEIVSPESSREGLQTDVYGVTLLFAECLTLTRPFLRDDPAAVMQAILHGADDSLLQDIPPSARDIVARGVAVDPADRFPNMRAVRAALLRVGPVADRATVRDWFVGA